MTQLATAYAYDENGAYLGETDVQEIEGRPGEYNMIPGCTLDPPPETDDQHYPRWTGEEWVIERVMSQIERYKAGIDPVPDGMVVDGDDLRQMNRTELVEAGKLTQAWSSRSSSIRSIRLASVCVSFPAATSSVWFIGRIASPSTTIPSGIWSIPALYRSTCDRTRSTTHFSPVHRG